MPLSTVQVISRTGVSRIGRGLRKLRSLRLDWGLPEKTDVLILFTDTARQLSSYFPGRRLTVLDLESPRRNFWVLLLSIASGSIRIRRYLSTYISWTKPDLVLSAQDNFEPLWFVRPKHRTVIALVQNGLRVEDPISLPVPRKSLAHRPKVDFYFCFNSSIGDFVSKSLDATYVSIGSFRCNHEHRISISPSEKISYISTFMTDIPLTSLISTSNHRGSVTYGSILDRRIPILIEVATFCDENGLRLELLGKDLDHNAEESFYRERLGQFQFSYIPRTAGSFQYIQCDTAKIVVSTGSTLGLESLARGNRTAVFDPLPLILGNLSLQFGWPVLIDPEGPFWSTQASPPRIRQILGSLLSASDEQWKQTLDTYRDALPYYDPANTVFVNQLSEYGARMIPSDKTPDILR